MIRLIALLLPLLALPSPAAVQAPPHFDSAVAPGSGSSQVFLTVDEALKLAFGKKALVEKRTVFLTDKQRAQVERLLGGRLQSGIVRPYVATLGDEFLGVAWFDSHRVRTQRQTLMFVTTPEGALRRIEVLAFGEPPEYLTSAKWMGQLLGRQLDDTLRVGSAIRPLAGSTLSARAMVDAARRSLALQAILMPPPAPEPDPQPEPEPPTGSTPAN